ncbi:MAG: ATP-dependent protease subunit HslV [Acidobacteriota bacterium]|jgi:ATP-dependent HslUV protease subunit HslV
MRTTGTTILCVRHRGTVAIAGDGQVSLGQQIMKHGARKVRRLHGGTVISGFAGSAADGFSLLTRFESRLEEHQGNLMRAAVELVKDWRTDRVLRRLEALLIVADARHSLLLSGTGDLIESDDGLLAVGSGGPMALAAGRALVRHTELDAGRVAEEALRIAAGIDVYTNERIVVEEIETTEAEEE